MRAALTPEQVVDAAVAVVERDGADQLSMRKLAAELGVSANTIYWHVGGREQVLDAVIARVREGYAKVRVQGATPRERVCWVARRIWRDSLDNHQVARLAHARGRTASMNLPLQLALARELSAAGLTGRDAAEAMRGILYAIAGLLLVAFRPVDEVRDDPWAEVADDAVDPGMLAALARPADLDALFERTLAALVGAWVPA